MKDTGLLVILNGDPPAGLLRRIAAGRGLPRNICPREESLPAGLHLMAADGGARALEETGLRADWIVGDLDSLNGEPLEEQRARGARLRHVPEQDRSDLVKCLETARAEGYRQIWIAGFEGSRFDMLLGLLALAPGAARWGRIHLLARSQSAVLIRPGSWSFTCAVGERFSLVAADGRPGTCTLEGLAWSGENLRIPPGCGGVSNRCTMELVRVTSRGADYYVIRDLNLADA